MPNPSLVQTKTFSGTGTTVTVTADTKFSSGSVIVLVFAAATTLGVSVSSVTDSMSSTYNLIDTATLNSGSEVQVLAGHVYAYAAYNVSGGSQGPITITFSTAGINCTGIVREYASLITSPLDVHNINSTTQTTNPTSPNVTTTNATDLLVGYTSFADAASPTVSVGSTYGNFVENDALAFYVAMEDKVVSATGTYNAPFVSSSVFNWDTGIMALEGTASSGRANNLTRLGVA